MHALLWSREKSMRHMNDPSTSHLSADMLREKNLMPAIQSTNDSSCLTFCQSISYDTEDQTQRYKNTGFDVNSLISQNTTDCNFPISMKVTQRSLNDGNDVFRSLNLMRANDKRSDLLDVQNNSLGDKEISLWDSFWNTQNSDTTDYSSFISPTSSHTSRTSNEYPINSFFDDSALSSSLDNSGRCANGWNSDCSNDYARERNFLSCDANLFESKDTNMSQSESNKELELVHCILSMSKEQLERVMRVIHVIVQNPQCVNETTRKKVDKPSRIQSSLPAPRQFAVSNDGKFSKDLSSAASMQKSIPYSSFSENDSAQKLEGRDRHSITVRGMVKAALSWNGELPKLLNYTPFSRKVFVGGLPYQINEKELEFVFGNYGNVSLIWPGKENKERFKGYVYIIFEKEKQVKNLLKSCRECNGDLYFTLPLPKAKSKEVQVIPWSILDSSYPTTIDPPTSLNSPWTVYVGALHGTVNAHGLFRIMNNLFGGVIHAGICIDKQKYPTGSGQVIFDSYDSYAKAITVGFVEIRTSKFTKMMQIEPFLKDSMCSVCDEKMGPYFCREDNCFRYFCSSCWEPYHKALRLSHDTPLMRNPKLLDLSDKQKKRTDFA